MRGYLSIVLHAHLPYVRHPEQEKVLEESWLYEAVIETYVPLLQLLHGWRRDGLAARLSFTLTPALCSMLLDPLLQERCAQRLEQLIEFADREIHRTRSEKPFHDLALFYRARLGGVRDFYHACGRDLVREFRTYKESGMLEILTSAATHALLPLLARHPPSLRAQVLVARDHYRSCFGDDPRGIWLPECAFSEEVEPALKEAGLRWFITDTHGILHARPRPRYAVFAPVLTPYGLAAFGRDRHSARQVWSRREGYPGDRRYRDFYRDAGYDLDFDYVKPYLPAPGQRGFTGIKYHRITDHSPNKQVYDRPAAMEAAREHAEHFLNARVKQITKLSGVLDRPPLLVSPYDAELFGHWWYEGPEFLDFVVRGALATSHRSSRREEALTAFEKSNQAVSLLTPEDYLRLHPENQIATPSSSSWGEEGYWQVWLNEKNHWIYGHLDVAQERMTELARRFTRPGALETRALKQAARELLLAQASDWPFILNSGTGTDYARKRVENHLLRFNTLYEQLLGSQINETQLEEVEKVDNIFPDVNYGYWS
jgi:1,4-alpha-glucan branching enzyme